MAFMNLRSGNAALRATDDEKMLDGKLQSVGLLEAGMSIKNKRDTWAAYKASTSSAGGSASRQSSDDEDCPQIVCLSSNANKSITSPFKDGPAVSDEDIFDSFDGILEISSRNMDRNLAGHSGTAKKPGDAFQEMFDQCNERKQPVPVDPFDLVRLEQVMTASNISEFASYADDDEDMKFERKEHPDEENSRMPLYYDESCGGSKDMHMEAVADEMHHLACTAAKQRKTFVPLRDLEREQLQVFHLPGMAPTQVNFWSVMDHNRRNPQPTRGAFQLRTSRRNVPSVPCILPQQEAATSSRDANFNVADVTAKKPAGRGRGRGGRRKMNKQEQQSGLSFGLVIVKSVKKLCSFQAQPDAGAQSNTDGYQCPLCNLELGVTDVEDHEQHCEGNKVEKSGHDYQCGTCSSPVPQKLISTHVATCKARSETPKQNSAGTSGLNMPTGSTSSAAKKGSGVYDLITDDDDEAVEPYMSAKRKGPGRKSQQENLAKSSDSVEQVFENDVIKKSPPEKRCRQSSRLH